MRVNWNRGPELKKWISFAELCQRWNINSYDLASIVIEGRLSAYDGDNLVNKYTVEDGSYWITSPYGRGVLKNDNLTVDKVKNFIFSLSDVVRFETENKIATKSMPKVPEIVTQEQTNIAPETFIRGLSVEFSSDTTIYIQPMNEKRREYSCAEIGLKSNSKPWKILLGVLHHHEYYAGIYSADKQTEKNRGYHRNIANMKEFSKKFVSFLNKTFNAQLPENFNLLENQHRTRNDRPGTYTPKFQIASMNTQTLSKDETLKLIADLSKKLNEETGEQAQAKLCDRINHYMSIAVKKEWIKESELSELLMPDKLSDDDALAHIDDRHLSY